MKDFTKFAFLIKLLEEALIPIAKTIVDDYYEFFAPDEEKPYIRSVNLRDLIDMAWCLVFEANAGSKWYVELQEVDVRTKNGKSE